MLSDRRIPRRCKVDQYIPAETAIRAAILSVEEMPINVLLTEAVILLGLAQDKVADYVDRVSDPESAI